jgi:hypothetical protein
MKIIFLLMILFFSGCTKSFTPEECVAEVQKRVGDFSEKQKAEGELVIYVACLATKNNPDDAMKLIKSISQSH